MANNLTAYIREVWAPEVQELAFKEMTALSMVKMVPMPDGDNIPVESTGMNESMQKQISTIRRQNMIINELIVAARNNNDTNKRLVSLKAS